MPDPSDTRATAPTDDQIITAIRDGCRTKYVADRLGMLNRRPYILRRLKRMEAAGKVRRHPQFSFAWDIYWEAAQ